VQELLRDNPFENQHVTYQAMLCLFTSFGNNFPNYTIPEFYEILPLCTANTVCAKPCNKIILFFTYGRQ
jgi:hypothetical protein